MTERYERLEDKPYASNYLLIEAVIDSPVAKVWPHALNIPAWMTDHRIESLVGEAGQVGSFAKVFQGGMGPEVPQPHHHYYGFAEVIPFKLIALEVFPEKGGSYGDAREWIAFDSMLFTEVNGSTRIAFLQIHLHRNPEPARDPESRQRDETIMRERLTRYFENLRQLVRSSV